MNQSLKAIVIAGVLSLVGLGGCVKPISQNDRMVQWWSMVRSPLYMRYHPDRWEYAGRLASSGRPGPNEYQVSFEDVIAKDGSFIMEGEPWFPDETKCGPFTALTNSELDIALLLDEQGQPLWAGAKIIPMHLNGQLKSLVLVEEVRVGQSYYKEVFQSYEGDYRPFYRFIRLSMHVAQDELKGSPLERLGIGFLTDMVNGEAASYVMDVSGKGDDLLSAVMLKGLGRWDDIRVTRAEAEAILQHNLSNKLRGASRLRMPSVLSWRLVAMDAWGRLVLGPDLPKRAKPLHVSIAVKTSPKITLSVFINGDKWDVWETKTYDPDTFDGRVID